MSNDIFHLSDAPFAFRLSLHVTPINNFRLKQWSFTPFNPATYSTRPRKTYFVFMTYGHEAPQERTMWILLENSAKKEMSLTNVGNEPALELAVATHYAHGNV